MKIEKINDHQIRCTLTSADLIARQLKLSELAYGTEKAKMLFQDMMDQANDEFGFEVGNAPLMIEAVPTSQDSISLIITKVDTPELIDSRFPKLSKALGETPIPVTDMKLEGFDNNNNDSSPFHMIRVFVFQHLDSIIRAAHMLKGVYDGSNSLYKDQVTNDYILVVSAEGKEGTDYFRVCNMLTEYGIQNYTNGGILAFLEEHCELMIGANALQTLAEF